MSKFDRPRQIIEYCLKPLDLDEKSEGYKEAFRRLEHVVKDVSARRRSREGAGDGGLFRHADPDDQRNRARPRLKMS